jgi:hypothetical protein
MNKPSLTPAQILAQIAHIDTMEFGKLSEYRRADRAESAGPYYKLQTWHQGQNHTRHVRPEELPSLRQALDGYARFCALTDQYAQLVVAQSRARLEQDVKKKIQPYSRHSRKKSKGSLNPS